MGYFGTSWVGDVSMNWTGGERGGEGAKGTLQRTVAVPHKGKLVGDVSPKIPDSGIPLPQFLGVFAMWPDGRVAERPDWGRMQPDLLLGNPRDGERGGEGFGQPGHGRAHLMF